ncbi:MAG: hypothetical protein ACRD04_02320 [Terriglobales bacterium]
MKISRLLFCLPALVAVLAVAAAAAPITYNVNFQSVAGVQFSGTLTVNGSSISSFNFDLSNAAGKLSDLGNQPGYTFFQPVLGTSYALNSSEPAAASVVSSPTDFFFIDGTTPGFTTQLELDFNSLPGSLNGYDSVLGQTNSSGEWQYYDILSGAAVVATPEPPTWTLAGFGMLLLGGLLFWSDPRHRIGIYSRAEVR